MIDHLSSTRVVLDSNGSILSTYDYGPFGKPLAKAGLGSRKSFIDREKDKESGLGNFGVRSYDDEVGLFTSIDPLWEDYRAYSPYNYCGNNPVKLSDPDGKAWPLVVYAIAEVAATVADVVDLATTIMNPNSSGLEITLSIVGVGAGVLAPGGGYGVTGKGIVKAFSKAEDVADGVKAVGKAVSTESKTAKEAFGKAKEANGIPRSQQPDNT